MAIYYIDCDDGFSGIYKNSANCDFVYSSLYVNYISTRWLNLFFLMKEFVFKGEQKGRIKKGV